jgi:hypothetical protein
MRIWERWEREAGKSEEIGQRNGHASVPESIPQCHRHRTEFAFIPVVLGRGVKMVYQQDSDCSRGL